jgi:hypothetical protein
MVELVEGLEIRNQPGEVRDTTVFTEELQDLHGSLEPVHLPSLPLEPRPVPYVEEEDLDEDRQNPGLGGRDRPPGEEPPEAPEHGGRRGLLPSPLHGDVGGAILRGREAPATGRRLALLQEPCEWGRVTRERIEGQARGRRRGLGHGVPRAKARPCDLWNMLGGRGSKIHLRW